MMKKIKYFAILFVTMLVVTGCGGSSNGKEILDEALENMKKVDKASMAVELNMGNEQYSMNMKVEGDFDEKSGNAYFKTSASIFGMNIATESYTIEKDNKVYTYTSEDGKTWYYNVEDASNSNSMTDLGAATKYAGDYKSVKKVKSDIKDHTKLEVTIAKDTMNKLMSEAEDTESLKITKDLVMFVYVKDGYVTKISMDLTEVIDSEDMAGLTKYSMSITMSNHNNISDIKVPESVIDSATLETDSE